MEPDKRAPKTNGSENPLNVASEKIEATRARVYGDGSSSLKDFVAPTRTIVSTVEPFDESESEVPRSINETAGIANEDEDFEEGHEGASDENVVPEISGDPTSSSCASEESETALSALSENEKWARNVFKKPLILAMRDIVAKQPSDPVNYLAAWLLNYHSAQERSRLLDERDRELAEERKRIQESCYSESLVKSEDSKDLGSFLETFEEDEQNGHSNFENYEIP